MSEKQIIGEVRGGKVLLPPSKVVREQLASAIIKVKFLRQILKLSEAHERLYERLHDGDSYA
jgi:hypothetical protein